MNYTIISFASVSKKITDKYINDNIKYISFLDDLYKLIDKHKNEINPDLLKDDKFRYLKDNEDLNEIINIDNLLEKYVNENDNIVVIHSLGTEYDEQMAMRFCQLVKELDKESISIFVIPFNYTGQVDLYESYLEYLNFLSKVYCLDCNDLRSKFSPDMPISEVFDNIYDIMYKIAYNINYDINIENIINETIKKTSE